jgi:predicted lipid-binding transport protein (Tim44 family)
MVCGNRTRHAMNRLLETIATHPLGVVGGAIAGALVGCAGGIAAGPLGSLLGALGGAVAGAVIGASIAVGPQVDVSEQDRSWRQDYSARPYVPQGASYDDYGPAYRHGSRAALRSAQPRDWAAAHDKLARGWKAARESSRLGWDEARPAVRDAWERVRATQR